MKRLLPLSFALGLLLLTSPSRADIANFNLSGKIYTKWLWRNNASQGVQTYGNPFWPENFSANSSQKVWAANFAAHHPNVCVLDLSSFKCGHDAPTYAINDAILQTSQTPSAALHDLDANKPGGSIKIRVETIDYFLRRYREDMVNRVEKKAKLEDRLRQYERQLRHQFAAHLETGDAFGAGKPKRRGRDARG